MPSFFMDVAPVSCERFSQFLSATNYKPEDSRGFLPSWPDWRAASYPLWPRECARHLRLSGGGTAILLVGGRAAADANLNGSTRRCKRAIQHASIRGAWRTTRAYAAPPTTGREAGSPYSSDAEHAMRGANPWGLRDLIGNVWQWVDEERADEHTRFNLLKGGSHYLRSARSPIGTS